MNRPTVHGGAARDDFFALPRWLNELLRLEIVWETRLRLNRLAPFGVSLLAVARRPGLERSWARVTHNTVSVIELASK